MMFLHRENNVSKILRKKKRSSNDNISKICHKHFETKEYLT